MKIGMGSMVTAKVWDMEEEARVGIEDQGRRIRLKDPISYEVVVPVQYLLSQAPKIPRFI